jgi:hypothetical protein
MICWLLILIIWATNDEGHLEFVFILYNDAFVISLSRALAARVSVGDRVCELFISGITINQFSAGLCNDILINCCTTTPGEMDLFLFPIVLLCAAFNEFYRHFARNKFLLMAFILSRVPRPANRLFLPGICFDWSGKYVARQKVAARPERMGESG